jgi:hypothetical protein
LKRSKPALQQRSQKQNSPPTESHNRINSYIIIA